MKVYEYEVIILDCDGESVAWFDCDDYTDANTIFTGVEIGAGGSCELLRREYESGQYIRTVVEKSKK